MSAPRPRHDALTGIRLFAAIWIVLHHIQLAHKSRLAAAYPEAYELAAPVLEQANRGLDLFFLLSGYVLGLNYLERLGGRFDLRAVGHYFWLRVARIWPTYLALTLFAGALIALRAWRWQSTSTDELTVASFVKQLFLVQLWDRPSGAGTSWAGPAWSLSAEWLAYALFPLMALGVHALTRRLGARGMVVAALVALTPMLTGLLVHHRFSYDFGWAPRVLCLFLAGMCVAAAVNKVTPTERERRVAGALAPAIVVGVLVWIALTETVLPGWYAGYIAFAWLPFVVCLSIGRGWFVSALSHRWVVLGGGASFALYLLHGPILKLFRDLTTETRFVLPDALQAPAEVALLPLLVLASCVIYTRYEEPARRVLSRLVSRRRPEAAAPQAVHAAEVPAPAAVVAEPLRTA
ncbi:MAG: acyltransferase family protein [Nocardioides sp.]|uniref:acyltransferase family protein n=1 Tax=Nocardioides sp. TaxID=35761 RepID=UPI003F08A2FA